MSYSARLKTFKPYTPDQLLLLPPALQDWLPEGHLALFISDEVDHALDLTPIHAKYETGDGRGEPPYHPALTVKLLVCASYTGTPSSRRIEKVASEEVLYRLLAANQHPGHDSLAAFRHQHLQALAGRFTQVLALCRAAGVVQLGHAALDGTKVLANASRYKAMGDGRMGAAERKLEQEVAAHLAQAQQGNAAEDARYGKGRRGDERPADLARCESSLAKIREAKAALEAESAAAAKRAERQLQAETTGRKPADRPPLVPDPAQVRPDPKAQRNFTDPESCIIMDGATKSFVQAYNAQAAVDRAAKIIGPAAVTQAANDMQ